MSALDWFGVIGTGAVLLPFLVHIKDSPYHPAFWMKEVEVDRSHYFG